MAMRSTFGESGFGEPEIDANTALTDLDKGLRSTKIGEQCEAIVRFPALFERYPFPILINSAFLKLADVFRTGSNFLRLWVLRVCQQCERHLEKILSIDEFVRRIFSVIHSNDPIARSLTLRTLGSLAGLISERKPIHHSIRVALDSHDRIEVSAAIYAAACFAKKSKTFGTTMCTKISSMVQRLSTPMDLKMRLVSVFQYMHHDVATASIVRKLCEELLVIHPSKEFVITTLNALTQLAASTKSDIGPQISLLLRNLDDVRPEINLNILRNLKFLAEEGGHLWEPTHISALLNFINHHISNDRMETEDDNESNRNPNLDENIVYTSLNVISSLAKSSVTFTSEYSTDEQLVRLLESNIESDNITSILKAIEIGTNITINWRNEGPNPLVRLANMTQSGLEVLLYALTIQKSSAIFISEDAQLCDLRKCLKYGITICKARPAQIEWLVNILIGLLLNEDSSISSQKRYILCEALGALGSINQPKVQQNINNLVTILERWSKKRLQDESCTVVLLISVILQLYEGFTIDHDVLNLIKNVQESSSAWVSYKIARNALRFGHPEISVKGLEGMCTKVSSENLHFFLSSLHSLSSGENILLNTKKIPNLLSRLTNASNMYLQAVVSLKAASSNTMSLSFQVEYVKLRADMLIAYKTFLISCGAMQFSPPPAIAPAIAAANRDELLKSGRVVTQLRKSIREFQNLSEMYGRLYQTAFDADNQSLANIQTLQQLCLLVVRAIEMVAVSKEHPSFSSSDQAFDFCITDEIESKSSPSLIRSCKLAVSCLDKLKTFPSQIVTSQHVDCLKECIRILVETPVTYPRFFFQTLQNTRAKIAVSPQPRVAGETVFVTFGNNLALKVEGVIEQRCAKGRDSTKLFRQPKLIRVTVVAVSTPRAHAELNKQMSNETVTMVEEVKPHKDFFTAQFLLNGWTPGITNLTIDTALVDFEGRLWITGPRATLSIRVHEDATKTTAAGGTAPASARATQSAGSSSQLPMTRY